MTSEFVFLLEQADFMAPRSSDARGFIPAGPPPTTITLLARAIFDGGDFVLPDIWIHRAAQRGPLLDSCQAFV